MQNSTKYTILKLLAENPTISQRELAKQTGISLGKANYCLRALIDEGWVKAENFRHSLRKIRYLYKLTPHGLEEKAQNGKGCGPKP